MSALYGKLLVVMGIAFPMSEVISTYIPPSFYDVSLTCVQRSHGVHVSKVILLHACGFMVEVVF